MSSMDVTRSLYCITAVAGTCIDGVLCPWLDLPKGGLAMDTDHPFQQQLLGPSDRPVSCLRGPYPKVDM